MVDAADSKSALLTGVGVQVPAWAYSSGLRASYESMSKKLPRLRVTLDVMPSPVPDQPGIILRDPFGYSDAVLLVPPGLAPALGCFDGRQTVLDLQAELTRRGGRLVPASEAEKLISTLDEAGFLETEAFEALRHQRHESFRTAPSRTPAHAGSGYPDDAAELGKVLDGYYAGLDGELHVPRATAPVLGLAAPHVSPFGGWKSYAATYRRLDPSLAPKTFVLLGTSHYGTPERFGLTRKPFDTPLGRAEVDQSAVDFLLQRAPRASVVEDYCHAVEHSIEFQVVFLQHVLRAPVRIVPILCGAFVESLRTGAPPEDDAAVAEFFEALGALEAERKGQLFWLLGIDLAHVGRRYGDPIKAVADQGAMRKVEKKDKERLDRVMAGDARGFFDLVRPRADELKWCGFPPLYTFLRSIDRVSGKLLRYEQWNIDPESVVSFAGLEFYGSPST